MTTGQRPADRGRMKNSTRPGDRIPARAFAWVSGTVGVLAGACLVGFFALDSAGVSIAGFSLGRLNDVFGVVQFATLAPVVWALGYRLPASRGVSVATVVGIAAALAYAALSVLLVAGLLTFAQQIGPLMVAITALYGWLLTVNLVAHRTRTLPRVVTRTGLFFAGALLTALVVVGAGYVLPGAVGQPVSWLGYGPGMVGWLGLPVYVLLLALRVFTPSRTTAAFRQSPNPKENSHA